MDNDLTKELSRLVSRYTRDGSVTNGNGLDAMSGPSVGVDGTFDIRSIDLVRQYVEHLVSRSTSGGTSPETVEIDEAIIWEMIQRSIAGSESMEEAVGRAIVVADQISRGSLEVPQLSAKGSHGKEHSSFFSVNMSSATPDFGDDSRFRKKVAEGVATHKALAAIALSMVMILIGVTYSLEGKTRGTSPARFVTPQVRVIGGNAQLVNVQRSAASGTPSLTPLVPPAATATLPAAVAPPAPAPPTLAGAAPLRPHEVFGFAPYWTLGQSAQFDVQSISTIAYFSIAVNPDGSLVESGPGWDGYQSQALADLVTRAHAVGDRVVLTVNCFDQSALNELTSSSSAPSTLATTLIGAIRAKNLDGVNLDFEGKGSADQSGLTNLVTQVSAAIHGADPHYQVTMDTYASSAGDPNGFYDVKALAPAVDAFFVMEYQLNLQSGGSESSPLTSTMFSDKTAIDQYLAAVPSSKVILGLPYFGIDWPTNNGTLSAQATGAATPVSYGDVMASGHPIYWDPTTDTAWASYLVGNQWHETFFEDPTSLYDAAQLANSSNLAGVGIWALGMDGNDPRMLSALLGFSPAIKDAGAGPTATSQSPSSSSTTSTTTSTTLPLSLSPSIVSPFLPLPTDASTTVAGTTTTSGTSTTVAGPTSTTNASTTTPSSTSTTTTIPPPVPKETYDYTGTWNGQNVTLTEFSPGTSLGPGTPVGQLSNFSTTDPSESCLSIGPSLTVESIAGYSDEYFVVAAEPGDCVNDYFVFTAS
jgi:spore germination protein YaaH